MRRTALFMLCWSAVSCAAADNRGPAEIEVGSISTTAFQDGVAPTASYSGTRDTMLEEDNPSTNHGADKKLSVSGDTPGGSGEDDEVLVQWDLTSAIPTSAIVRAATLTLTVTDKADQPYALFEALRPWSESSGTWKRASTALNWETNGAKGVTDRGTTPLGIIQAPTTGQFTIVLNGIGVGVVQRWVTHPSTNHGFLFAGTDNDNRLEFSSREDTKSSRPRLEVTWQSGTGGGADPSPGSYQQTCDGSAAIAVDASHFLNFNDESQVARIYTRATSAGPVQQLDVSSAIGMTSSDEADFEDAARIGNRVYVITSHGRDKDGVFAPTRYRFMAIDLSGTVPSLQMTVAGSSSHVLIDMLNSANWDHPDPTIIAALQASSQLSVPSDPNLAPEAQGLNIEGLGSYPSPTNPARLLIGLRNPHASGRAIFVTLQNPDQVIAGATARFGEVIELDLGGLGVRSIAWSDALQALLLIAGPPADVGAVRLFTWSGDPASTPTIVQDLVAPDATAAEAVVPYPGTKDVQILFDFGGLLVNGTECKKLPSSAQSFTDQIVHFD